MTEKAAEEPIEQDPLFVIGEGTYGNRIEYNAHQASETVPAVQPEKPKLLMEMSPDEMIQTALEDRLTLDTYDSKRNEFVEKHNWIPYRELEVTASIAEDRFNNPPLVVYLLGTRRSKNVKAVSNVISQVERIKKDALEATEYLREAQDIETGRFIPTAVRSNVLVRQIIARHVFARSSLDRFEWPDHFIRRTKTVQINQKVDQKLQSLTEKLSSLDDDKLKLLAEKTLGQQQARLKYWADQYNMAKQHEDTRDLITSAATNA